MPYIERETTKLFYSIGEVARIFNVNASLIRFWEKEFDIIKPQKNKKGNRLFTKTDIENFKTIFHLLKERGFTIEGAKKKLKEGTTETINQVELIEKLTGIKEKLILFRKNLEKE